MAINKINYKGETIVDLSVDTIVETSVKEGVIFHGADGVAKIGTFVSQEKEATENGEIVPDEGKYLSKVTVNVSTGAGGGIVDVETLPTESIDTNTFYRTKEEKQKDPVVYCFLEGMILTVEELFALMVPDIDATITYTVVPELPETMEPMDEATFTIPIYVLESDGVAYLSLTGLSSDAVPFGTLLFGPDAPIFGWINNTSEIIEPGLYTLRGESFFIDHYWSYQNSTWTEFIATIDVSELPTEGIELNTIYRLTEVGAMNMYVATQGTVTDYNALVTQQGGEIVYYLVGELPEVGEPMSGTTMPIYVIKDTGAAYVFFDIQSGFVPISTAVGVPDRGWTEDPTTIVDDGVYMYAEPGVVRYFVYKNGEMVEYAAGGSGSAGFADFFSNAELEHLALPEGLTQIAPYACYGRNYSAVTIPATVKSIGAYAFANCENLTAIYYDATMSLWESVELGEKWINGECVIECKDGIISSDGVVYKLNNDKTAYMVDSFRGDSTNVNILSEIHDVPITSIRSNVFRNCGDITSINIPDSVTSIGEEAFYGCTSLTSITIPDGVISIGKSAFYNCQALIDIVIPDSVTNIGTAAFSNCQGLMNVTIGSGMTNISDHAFFACKSLTNIAIPNSITNIGKSAFSYCINLTSVIIPDSVIAIGAYAFQDCTNLTSVYIEDIAAWCAISFGDSNMYGSDVANPLYHAKNLYLNGALVIDLIIPDGVTSICHHAFNGCTGFKSIVIGNNVTSIGSYAFSNCSGATSIIISDSVTNIDSYAFYACTGLTSITITKNVVFIGTNAFYGCHTLVEIINFSVLNFKKGSTGDGYVAYYAKEIHSGESKIVNINNYSFYTYQNTHYLLNYTGDETELSLPINYNGEHYEIYNFAFYYRTELTSVTISDSVVRIGNTAFSGCSSLTSVTIGNGVTSIGNNVFKNCTSLIDIIIPKSVTSIGEQAFCNCTSLTNMVVADGNSVYHSAGNCIIATESRILIAGCKESVIPADGSVSSIGSYAFYNCTGLTNITIPDGITDIGALAFYNCTGLTNVTIPNGVIRIENKAFSGCTGLTGSITIPNSVTSIGMDAFGNCSSLTNIVFGSNVTNIGQSAFSNCSSCLIFDFSALISVPVLDNYIFSNTSADKQIIVPDALYDSWIVAQYWSEYATNIVKASEAA